MEGGGCWPDPPRLLRPPMVPAKGGGNFLTLKSSFAEEAEENFVPVSLKQWKRTRGGGGSGGGGGSSSRSNTSPGACTLRLFPRTLPSGCPRDVSEERQGEGSRTQKLAHQKWPKSIFPFVNFIFSH